jgi:hypothetical protein
VEIAVSEFFTRYEQPGHFISIIILSYYDASGKAHGFSRVDESEPVPLKL